MQPNLESLGRYTLLCDRARELAQQRMNLLQRLGAIVRGATDTTCALPAGAIARRCNFAGMQALLNEATAADAALVEVLAEIDQVAPEVGKPGLRIA